MGLMLEIEGLTCGYGRRPVLSDVTLTVRPGENLCLLGPNGVGKTTLFRTILGLNKPMNGSIRMGGSCGCSRREMAHQVAYVPQAHTPPFPFAVIDVVLAGRTSHFGTFSSPSARDVDIAEESLDALGILELRGRTYTEISGGERQLVLIARALAQRPQVLLMDEPSSNLDFGNQIRLLLLVKRLVATRNLGVLMSTHFPNHAFLCASEVALLKGGKILAIGDAVRVMTEANLEEIYGLPIRIMGGNGSGEVRVCAPKIHEGELRE
jgi:iron complex transport system ATP-binding protein